MRLTIAATVALLGASLATQAGAAPIAKSDGIAASGIVTTVDNRRDHRRHDDHRRNEDRRNWGRGDYERHGWHRHSHRPYNWRGRGCVTVGPVWFCP